VPQLPAIQLAETFDGIDLLKFGSPWLSSSNPDLPWTKLSLGALSFAVDTSLGGAIGASIDSRQTLVRPFAQEAAGWAAWLPSNPHALRRTKEAAPAWLTAEAHVLTRTSLAAAVPAPQERSDTGMIDGALDAARRRAFSLELPVPGTPYRLLDVLEIRAPDARRAFDGALHALSSRGPDAPRHVAVSIREAVKSVSRAISAGDTDDGSVKDRWRRAVGRALNDPDHGAILAAQIDLLVSVGGATSAAIHGRDANLERLEVVFLGVVAALSCVLSSWVITTDIRL
jgi:hypothetical protein